MWMELGADTFARVCVAFRMDPDQNEGYVHSLDSHDSADTLLTQPPLGDSIWKVAWWAPFRV